MESRPPIPAEIRRRVLVEAGHRCAIPTCRHIDVDIHHIIPWAEGQSHDYDNLIALCPNCHARADSGKIDRKSLGLYKVNLRFSHDKFSQLEIDLLFEAARLAPAEAIQWPPSMLILIKRIIESGLLEIVPGSTGIKFSVRANGMELAPVHLVISSKGRLFISELGRREL